MTKLFITLGPSTLKKEFLESLNSKYIKLLRINLSHTEITDLMNIVKFIRKHTKIDICFDTEGAQIRNTKIVKNNLLLKKGKVIYINKSNNNKNFISLSPRNIYKKLRVKDILHIDFNSAKIKITDESDKLFKCLVLEGGIIGSNKSISVNRNISIPPFTEKDLLAFQIAQELSIKNIALSFTSNASEIKKLRTFFNYKIIVTSKIESKKALKNLDSILKETDIALIDRGDLSKEVPLPLIPKKQKDIIKSGKKRKTPVFVATNLLESMVTKKEPTRAEVNDIYNTLIDGASGLVLAAETAVGNYPKECIDMVVKISKTCNN